jgi:hypothetical protein
VNSLKGKTYWCGKHKKHLQVLPKKAGFVSTAVGESYDDLRKASNKDPTFIAATRIADRAFKDLEAGRLEEASVRHTFRAVGGGRRCKAPDVREEIFQ